MSAGYSKAKGVGKVGKEIGFRLQKSEQNEQGGVNSKSVNTLHAAWRHCASERATQHQHTAAATSAPAP
jgi:hypothetical protein